MTFLPHLTPEIQANAARNKALTQPKEIKMLTADERKTLDDAMMLVPEGWNADCYFYRDGAGFVRLRFPLSIGHERIKNGEARSPALALTAACLRARALSRTAGEGEQAS